MSIGERDDSFDFSEMIFGEPTEVKEGKQSDPTPNTERPPATSKLSYDTEVQSSYLLVNALLTLLIRKGIVHTHEVQALISELHVEYIRKKKGRDLNEDK